MDRVIKDTIEYLELQIQSILRRPGMYGSAETITMLVLSHLEIRDRLLYEKPSSIYTAWRSFEHKINKKKPGPIPIYAYWERKEPNKDWSELSTRMAKYLKKFVKEWVSRENDCDKQDIRNL